MIVGIETFLRFVCNGRFGNYFYITTLVWTTLEFGLNLSVVDYIVGAMRML